MATITEIEAAIQQDPDFIKLMQSGDTEKATAFAEEAFKLADKSPSQPTQPTPTPSQPATQADGPLRTYVRPLLEAGGAIGGAALGAPLGPGGVLTGGVIGGAGGSAAADVVEQVGGEQRPPKNIRDVEANLTRNIETGMLAEAGGQVFNFGMKALQKLKQPFSHLIDPDKKRVMDLAEEMGVELSAADITKSKPLAMFVEGIGERTPFSAGVIERFRMGSLQKLVERRNDMLERGGTPEAIEETGKRIQIRTQELMDELGVTNDAVRKQMMESTLQKLGSTETFEQLGVNGQAATVAKLKKESERVGGIYDSAFSLVPPESRVLPPTLQGEAKTKAAEYVRLNPKNRNSTVEGWLETFSGSGNPKFDEQDRMLTVALEGVPPQRYDKATKQIVKTGFEEEARRFLGGAEREKPGYTMEELNFFRKRLNSDIDQIDAGLKLSGQTGVKGVGSSAQNDDKSILLGLKKALDADIAKFSEETGGEFKGAYDLARKAAGEFKGFASSKGVAAYLRAQPQEAAKMLAQSKDLQAIRQLKTTLGPAFKNVEDAFSNELLGVGKEGTIGPQSIRAQLNKYPKGVAEAILGTGKLQKIQDFARQLDTLDAAAINNPIFKTILKANPERVVGLIVKPGNTENIVHIRKMLGEEAVHDLARGMANKILRKPEFNVPEEEFIISPAKLLSGLRQLGDDTLGELFRHDPTFLKEMKQLSEVANASQGAARLAANPSGTGQSLIAFGELTMTIMSPKTGITMALGIPAVTKLYLSKTGRKWLTTGFKTSPTSNTAAEIFGKLMGVATADATQSPPSRPVHPLSVTQQALSLTHPQGRAPGGQSQVIGSPAK